MHLQILITVLLAYNNYTFVFPILIKRYKTRQTKIKIPIKDNFLIYLKEFWVMEKKSYNKLSQKSHFSSSKMLSNKYLFDSSCHLRFVYHSLATEILGTPFWYHKIPQNFNPLSLSLSLFSLSIYFYLLLLLGVLGTKSP